MNPRTYMYQNKEDHRDPLTDEINDTTLAEDAWQAIKGDSVAPDAEIDDRYFYWAFLIAEADRRARTKQWPSSLGGVVRQFDDHMRD